MPSTWEWLRSHELFYQRLARSYKVHQFHSGPSTDDAVINSMLLLQKTLRGLGYESEIFVEHRDPALSDRLFEVSRLPSRGDYALIVHHSNGQDINDQITASPERKILMFHDLVPRSATAGYANSVAAQPHMHRGGAVAGLRDGQNAVTSNPGGETNADHGDQRDVLARSKLVRIAWISTWDVRCGIAEHSMSLLKPLIDRPDGTIAALTILCDDRTPPAMLQEWVSINPCWNGIEPIADRLGDAVSATDADIVVIQHQPGLIRWAGLVELLNDPRVRHRKIVVALHAARRLLDLEPAERAATLEALRKVSCVLVHGSGDVDLLKSHGIASNVTLFPLGAEDQYCVPVLRSLAQKDRIVIGCYGFFLPGKGIDRLIKAFAVLRKTWPHLSLQLTNAEYSEVSHAEIARCRDLACKLGVLGAIEWDTTFHTREESMLKLAQCDLVVLPYDESKESASAALHSAMASGVPIAVTPVSIFNDASEAVFRFATNDVMSLANGIDTLLRDRELRQQIQLAASQWLSNRNWANLSRRLQGMLIGLSACDRTTSPIE